MGGPGHDRVAGNDGADFLKGGLGHDRLRGDTGKEWLIGGLGDDLLDGGGGLRDVISYAESPGQMVIDLEAGTAKGEGDDTLVSVRWLVTSHFDDTVFGTGGKDHIFDVGGSDSVVLGDGPDDFEEEFGETATKSDADSIDMGPGNDFAWTEEGHDSLDGGLGDDFLSSGSGDDLIDGGEGDDTIDGNDGSDTCTNGENVSNCEA